MPNSIYLIDLVHCVAVCLKSSIIIFAVFDIFIWAITCHQINKQDDLAQTQFESDKIALLGHAFRIMQYYCLGPLISETETHVLSYTDV